MAKKNKTKDDEEFERLSREFIDAELNSDDTPDDTQTTNDLDDQTTNDLPFLKEIDDRVADTMMNADREDGNYQRDVASVSVEVGKGFSA